MENDAEKTHGVHSSPEDGGTKSRKYKMAREGFWSIWAVSSLALFCGITMFTDQAERLGANAEWWLWAMAIGVGLNQNAYGIKNVVGKSILGKLALAREKLIRAKDKPDA